MSPLWSVHRTGGIGHEPYLIVLSTLCRIRHTFRGIDVTDASVSVASFSCGRYSHVSLPPAAAPCERFSFFFHVRHHAIVNEANFHFADLARTVSRVPTAIRQRHDHRR